MIKISAMGATMLAAGHRNGGSAVRGSCRARGRLQEAVAMEAQAATGGDAPITMVWLELIELPARMHNQARCQLQKSCFGALGGLCLLGLGPAGCALLRRSCRH